jgi:hypothetical protein
LSSTLKCMQEATADMKAGRLTEKASFFHNLWPDMVISSVSAVGIIFAVVNHQSSGRRSTNLKILTRVAMRSSSDLECSKWLIDNMNYAIQLYSSTAPSPIPIRADLPLTYGKSPRKGIDPGSIYLKLHFLDLLGFCPFLESQNYSYCTRACGRLCLVQILSIRGVDSPELWLVGFKRSIRNDIWDEKRISRKFSYWMTCCRTCRKGLWLPLFKALFIFPKANYENMSFKVCHYRGSEFA